MTPTEEIAIKLGIKNADLKAVLADSGADIKKFKKEGESGEDEGFMGQLKGIKRSLKDVKDVVIAGGIVTAVLGFFDQAIEKAKMTEGAIDANTAAVLRMGSRYEEVKDLFANATVTLTGWFAQLGEGIGKAAAGLVYGRQAVADSEKLAALEAERFLQKAKQKEVDEKLKTINEQITAEAKKTNELRTKGLEDADKLAKLTKDVAQAQALLAAAGDDEVRRRNALLNVKKAENELLGAQLEIEKKKAAEAEQNAKAQAKALTERLDAEHALLPLAEQRKLLQIEEKLLLTDMAGLKKGSKEYSEDENRLLEVQKKLREANTDQSKINAEIAKLLLVGEANLNGVEKERLALLRGQTTEMAQQAEVEQLLTRGVENLTEEEKNRLGVLIGQTAEMKQQTREIDEQTRKQRALNDLYSKSLQSKGDSRNLNDTQLDALLQRIEQQLFESENEDSKVSGVFGKYTSPITYQLRQQLQQIKDEQNKRDSFAKTQAFFGDDYAQRQFAPDEYDRLSRLFNPDQQKQQAQDIAQINRTLSGIFHG